MTFFVYKRVFCLDLRLCAFIVAYWFMIIETLKLLKNVLALTKAIDFDSDIILEEREVFLVRFLVFLNMLIICFKVMFCVALLIGLYKKLAEQVEIFCVVFTTLLVVESIFQIIRFYNIPGYLHNMEHIIYLGVILSIQVIDFLGITVMRSYYIQMYGEERERDFILTPERYNTKNVFDFKIKMPKM